MSLIESQFTPSGMTQVTPIALSPDGNIYVNANNANGIRIYSNSGTFITSVNTNDTYSAFYADGTNGIMYCGGVSTLGKLNLVDNSFSSVSSTGLNSVPLGPDGFIYAVTNTAYQIRRINPATFTHTVIFTNSTSIVNADASGIFGGSAFDSKGFLYGITRGVGYVYKFDTCGNCLGLFSTVNSAYGSTFSLATDQEHDITYTVTMGSPGAVYRIDKYGISTLHTTFTGQSRALNYDPYTKKVYVTSNSLNTIYRIARFTPPATTTHMLNTNGLVLYYPFDVDTLNYASGSGVNDISSSSISISRLFTMVTSGSVRFPGTTSQFIQLPNIQYSPTGLTVGVWVRCNAIGGNNFQLYMSKVFDFGNGGGADSFAFSFANGGYTSIFTNGKLYNSYKLNDSLWHHYCVTVDSSGNARYYVDGSAQQMTNGGFTYTVIPAGLSYSTVYTKCYICKSNTASDKYLDANLNNFMLFNRAITPTELTAFSSFYTNISTDPPYPCFLKGSKILRLNLDYDEEEYIEVERLKKGDLIKTATCGYKAVAFIGRATLKRPADDPDRKNRLYTFKAKGFQPLSITGEHCTLHKKLTDEKRREVREYMGDDFITEEFCRVPACLDDRAEPYAGKGPATIWHFALEHNNLYNNYAVYANGILVETCSIDYLLNRSNMELAE